MEDTERKEITQAMVEFAKRVLAGKSVFPAEVEILPEILMKLNV
jgi:hypothetical protein